jgi:hypothetical protein
MDIDHHPQGQRAVKGVPNFATVLAIYKPPIFMPKRADPADKIDPDANQANHATSVFIYDLLTWVENVSRC